MYGTHDCAILPSTWPWQNDRGRKSVAEAEWLIGRQLDRGEMRRMKTNKKLSFNSEERQKRDAETEDELEVRLLRQRKISELLWTVLCIIAR